jgi:hypothetical protein
MPNNSKHNMTTERTIASTTIVRSVVMLCLLLFVLWSCRACYCKKMHNERKSDLKLVIRCTNIDCGHLLLVSCLNYYDMRMLCLLLFVLWSCRACYCSFCGHVVLAIVRSVVMLCLLLFVLWSCRACDGRTEWCGSYTCLSQV